AVDEEVHASASRRPHSAERSARRASTRHHNSLTPIRYAGRVAERCSSQQASLARWVTHTSRASRAHARQLVAKHGNGFPLFELFSALSDLPPAATGCVRWLINAPYLRHA